MKSLKTSMAVLLTLVSLPLHGRLDAKNVLPSVPNEISFTAKAEPTVQKTAILNPKEYIASEAKKLSVNPDLALCIVQHESKFEDVSGDDGQSLGYWQISTIWHPEVPRSCSHSLSCSTKWSLDRIKKGYVKEWSTYRNFCSQWAD